MSTRTLLRVKRFVQWLDEGDDRTSCMLHAELPAQVFTADSAVGALEDVIYFTLRPQLHLREDGQQLESVCEGRRHSLNGRQNNRFRFRAYFFFRQIYLARQNTFTEYVSERFPFLREQQ